jgi:hypothetical protein
MFIFVLTVVAFLVWAYAICILIDCARRDPLNRMSKLANERRQSVWTVVLIVATLVLGFGLEKLLP